MHLQFHSAGFMCPFYVHAPAPAFCEVLSTRRSFKQAIMACLRALTFALIVLQAVCPHALQFSSSLMSIGFHAVTWCRALASHYHLK